MTFMNASNQSRVRKIEEALALLEKSGAANSAGPMDYAIMLSPVQQRISQMTAAPSKPLSNMGLKSVRWRDMDEMIADLDIREVGKALSKLTIRLEDYIYDKEGSEFK